MSRSFPHFAIFSKLFGMWDSF